MLALRYSYAEDASHATCKSPAKMPAEGAAYAHYFFAGALRRYAERDSYAPYAAILSPPAD